MLYFAQPTLDEQRKPLVPNKLISGMLPGATQIRLGGNEGIVIDGLNQRISVVNSGTTISLGNSGDGSLVLNLNDGANDVITVGTDNDDTTGFAAYDSAGTKRLLAGTYPDDTIKIKLSQSGYDVATATDDQLIWSSDFNLFKIVSSGTGIVSTSGTGTFTTNIAHGLSATPAFIAFGNYPTGSADQWLHVPVDVVDISVTGTFDSRMIAYADATNLTFQVSKRTAITDGDWRFRYYILKETSSGA